MSSPSHLVRVTVCLLAVLCSTACNGPPEPTATTTPEPSATATPEPPATSTSTPLPTATLAPTATFTPTRTPVPPTATTPPAPTVVPATATPRRVAPRRPQSPNYARGSGQQVTEEFTPLEAVSVVVIAHEGQSNFIVQAHRGADEQLLVNTIGAYHGERPLAGSAPVRFGIKADGTWTVQLLPLSRGGQPAVSGRGDTVSALFSPPSPGPWEFAHTGESNVVVKAHCVGGSDLVVNEIGALRGSIYLTFPRGPCFWEIQADGEWRLQPQQ